MNKIRYKKVIIWGYPLYSHTHSYVHEGYYRAFKSLGFDTYWFHDRDFPDPSEFDYSDSLYIGEGFADHMIPINDSSCYCIMYCPNPQKYEGAGNYIDIRMNAVNFSDHIQSYSLDRSKEISIGPTCYFFPKSGSTVRVTNNYIDCEMKDFHKFYMGWATNLLPDEIDFNWIDIPRSKEIHFCGSISREGDCENHSNIQPFINECSKNGISFIHNCPWANPISNEEVMARTQASLMGVDIRGKTHIKQGLLTCRTFKNISYGHVGVTNSHAMFEALNGNCVFNSESDALFYDGLSLCENKKLALAGMKEVKANHTFINRIESILSAL